MVAGHAIASRVVHGHMADGGLARTGGAYNRLLSRICDICWVPDSGSRASSICCSVNAVGPCSLIADCRCCQGMTMVESWYDYEARRELA